MQVPTAAVAAARHSYARYVRPRGRRAEKSRCSRSLTGKPPAAFTDGAGFPPGRLIYIQVKRAATFMNLWLMSHLSRLAYTAVSFSNHFTSVLAFFNHVFVLNAPEDSFVSSFQNNNVLTAVSIRMLSLIFRINASSLHLFLDLKSSCRRLRNSY